MDLRQLIFLLAVAPLSIAAGCPFAKFAKAGGEGSVPEIDHAKLNDFVAQMKKYAPHDEPNAGDSTVMRNQDFGAGSNIAYEHEL